MSRNFLFERMWMDDECSIRYDEARRLAESLFDTNVESRRVIPFFTDHTPRHFKRVGEILSEIIFGLDPGSEDYTPSLDDRAFDPSPEEAMYLLSAAWLHDIGMVYGIFADEKLDGPDTPWEHCRDEHEERAVKFIQECWKDYCQWSRFPKIYLSTICRYHRKRHPLDLMEPIVVPGKMDRPVRLRELCSLLRLADACHIDETRTPMDMRNHFEAIGMPVSAKEHWSLPLLIHQVQFNHPRRSIDVKCLIPQPHQYGTVVIDFEPAVERLAESIRLELLTVVPYLSNYSNIGFRSVEYEVAHPDVINRDSLLRKMWPCMLSMVSSASAVASMVAAAVLATVRESHAVPEKEIKEILKRAVETHPYNVLVWRLHDEISDMLGRTGIEEMTRYLGDYGAATKAECEDVAANAAEQLLEPNDVIVIYSYSTAVMAALVRSENRHRVLVLVVKCYRTEPGVAVRDENERLIRELRNAKLRFRVVEMASLNQIFACLRADKKAVKVLLGTRGVLDEGRVVSTVGYSQIALAAKDSGIKVFVIAESKKRSDDPGILHAIEGELAEQVSSLRDMISEAARSDSVPSKLVLAAHIECLPRDLYHSLVGPGLLVNSAEDEDS